MLLGIGKRGDSYLRTLLIHGARSVVRITERKADKTQSWLTHLIARRHKHVATVALANKNARIVLALMTKREDYQFNYNPSLA